MNASLTTSRFAHNSVLANKEGTSNSSQSRASIERFLRENESEVRSLDAKLPEHVASEVLVKLPDGTTEGQIDTLAIDYDADLVHRFQIPKQMRHSFGGEMVWLRMNQLSTSQAMTVLGKDDRVLYATANDLRPEPEAFNHGQAELSQERNSEVPDDLDPQLYGMHKISAPEAWQTSTGSRDGAIVALLDTGTDYTHSDLAANIWQNPGEIPGNGKDDDGNGVVDDVHGYDSVLDKGDPKDRDQHGTHCAGTIGAVGNNGQGVVGVNWETQIMPIRALGRGGSSGTIIRALMYATEQGAKVTSNSWGYSKTNQAEADAFRASPLLHICASGNEGNNNDKSGDFPSGLPDENIVSVAWSDHRDRLSRHSNYGVQTVDLAAPGDKILSTIPGNRYAKFSGTSMSTPHVAGAAGLISTSYPELSPAQIKIRLLNSVDRFPQLEGKVKSGGRLNVARALEYDTVAPAGADDIAVAETKQDSVRLQFTASADDGHSGAAASAYYLASSEAPLDQSSVLRRLSQFPVSGGEQDTTTVKVIPSREPRTLHLGLQIEDNVGNRSELQSVTAEVPAGNIAFDGNAEGDWVSSEGFTRVTDGGQVSWSDSPDGEYQNGTEALLLTKMVDLRQKSGTRIGLDMPYDLERGHDTLTLQYRPKNRWFWRTLHVFEGRGQDDKHVIDASKLDGYQAEFRLQLKTDESVTRDGINLNRFVIYSEPET